MHITFSVKSIVFELVRISVMLWCWESCLARSGTEMMLPFLSHHTP